ncbi:MAG: glycosyltransferase [Lachnospiraceae bacterium]|nr:glycosyltransferase [Lachnospiraceae bacterium]
MQNIRITIVMPTYNSEKTIERTLKSIRGQTFEQDAIEILVIDGGSTDNTINIAKKYGVIVLENPDRIPETAKRIGFSYAHGEYIIMQDSDEVWCRKNQLSMRIKFFENNPDVFCLITDKLIPGKGCGLSCAYLNMVADPFSYIIYQKKYSNAKQNRKYLIRETKFGNVYQYKKDDIAPIGDGGCTMINLNKAKAVYGDKITSQEFATSIFIQMVNATHKVGIIPEDNIVHYSTASLKSFLKKLQFRVHINLNDVEKSGYESRARYNKKLQRRKVLFVLYALTIIGPVWDSLRLSVLYKRPSILLHFFYTYYICVIACAEIIMKKIGVSGEYSYGK